MVQNAKKIVLPAMMACVAALLAPMSNVARAESQPIEKILQPQALNHAGIYELRQIDPNLTGFGVKFAVVCRSITYIDGEPQNDYRPSTEHNSLGEKQLSFHDQA